MQAKEALLVTESPPFRSFFVFSRAPVVPKTILMCFQNFTLEQNFSLEQISLYPEPLEQFWYMRECRWLTDTIHKRKASKRYILNVSFTFYIVILRQEETAVTRVTCTLF